MKIDLHDKRVVAVIDDRNNAKYPKVTVVIDEELGGQYDNHLAFEFGKSEHLDKRADLRVGQRVDVSGYLGSRVSGGRYWTAVRGTFAKIVGGVAAGDDRREQAPPFGDDDVNF